MMNHDKGEVVSIHIVPRKREFPVPMAEIHAVPGKGLQGDHHFRPLGDPDHRDPGAIEVTLIESEELEALARDFGYRMATGATRRNIMTRGIRLNDLVGREFTVGEVRMRCIRLCEPCTDLAAMTDRIVLKALVHKAGIRALIMSEGTIRPGDPISME